MRCIRPSRGVARRSAGGGVGRPHRRGARAEAQQVLVLASTPGSAPPRRCRAKPSARSVRSDGRGCGGSTAWPTPRPETKRIFSRPWSAASRGLETLALVRLRGDVARREPGVVVGGAHQSVEVPLPLCHMEVPFPTVAPPLSKRLKRYLRYGLLRAVLAVVGRAAARLGAGARAGAGERGVPPRPGRAAQGAGQPRGAPSRRCPRRRGWSWRGAASGTSGPRRWRWRWRRGWAPVSSAGGRVGRGARRGWSRRTGGAREWCASPATSGTGSCSPGASRRRASRCRAVAQGERRPAAHPAVRALPGERAGCGTCGGGSPGRRWQLLRALRKGELLGMLIDQDTRVQYVFVPFFGQPAATPRAAADLALRTGAAALVCLNHRDADGSYRTTTEEVEVPRTGDDERDAVELTAALHRSASRPPSALHPEQWVWMHQRWKTKPARALSRAGEASALAALTLFAACRARRPRTTAAAARGHAHEVRLRSYRGSMLTAVGRSESMAYYRASADVLSGPGTLDVLSREAPGAAGRLAAGDPHRDPGGAGESPLARHRRLGRSASCGPPTGSRGRPDARAPRHAPPCTPGGQPGRGPGAERILDAGAGIRPAPARGPVRVRSDAEPGERAVSADRRVRGGRARSAARRGRSRPRRRYRRPGARRLSPAEAGGRKAALRPVAGKAPARRRTPGGHAARHAREPSVRRLRQGRMEGSDAAVRLHRAREAGANTTTLTCDSLHRPLPRQGRDQVTRLECFGNVRGGGRRALGPRRPRGLRHGEGGAGAHRQPRGAPGHQHHAGRPGGVLRGHRPHRGGAGEGRARVEGQGAGAPRSPRPTPPAKAP